MLGKSEIEKHYSISDLNTVLCIWIKKTSVRIMESTLKGNGVYKLIFVVAECMLCDDRFVPGLHRLMLINPIRTKVTQLK